MANPKVGVDFVGNTKSFDKAAKKYDKGLKKAVKATKALQKSIEKQTEMLSRQRQPTQTATKEIDKLGMAWKTLGPIIGVVGVAMMARGGIQLAKLGAESLRMKTSFQELARQAGASGDEILESLRDASRGTVDNTSLMLAANRAMMLGLGADAEQLGKLMEVAAFRGKAMGLTVQQAFTDMTTGIGRKSIMILDNLGIVGLKMGATTTQADIMAQVINQGMEQIQEAGGVASDEAEGFERLDASWKNLKTAIGENIAGPVAGAANALAEGISTWAVALGELKQTLADIQELGEGPGLSERVTKLTIWSPEAAAEMQALVTQTGSMQVATDAMAQSIADATSDIRIMTQADRDLAYAIEAAGVAHDLTSGKIDREQEAIRGLKPMIDITVKSLEDEWNVRRRLDKAKEAGILTLQEYRAAILHVKYQVVNLKDAESRAAQVADDAAFAAGRLASMQRQVAEATALATGAFRDEERQLYESQRVLDDYIDSVWEAATATKQVFGHANIMTPQGRQVAALEMAKELAGKFNTVREQEAKDEIIANKASADDFRAKMEGANNIIAGDITSKIQRALGIIDPMRQPGPGQDAPAEPVRRLLDVAQQGESSQFTEGLRQQIADAWDALRPGEGIGNAILNDEGTMKMWAQKLYDAAADPQMGAGLLKGLETATGDEWINEVALAHELGVIKGMENFVAKGWENLQLPAEIIESGSGEGTPEVWNNKGQEIGGLLTDGVNTGLVMESGKTPLKPLDDDLKDVIKKIKNFKEIWDNLDDKNITLFIDIEGGGGGGGDGGGEADMGAGGTGPPGGLSMLGQHGLDMMVPPGYPNDTFPLRVTSGERIIVQTPAQQSSAGRPITIGPNYINNDMDMIVFENRVRRVVGRDLE